MEDEKSRTLTLVLVALQNNELEFYLLFSLPPPYCLLPVTGFRIFLILRNKSRCTIVSMHVCGTMGRG